VPVEACGQKFEACLTTFTLLLLLLTMMMMMMMTRVCDVLQYSRGRSTRQRDIRRRPALSTSTNSTRCNLPVPHHYKTRRLHSTPPRRWRFVYRFHSLRLFAVDF